MIDHITVGHVDGKLEGDARIYFESPHSDEYMDCKYKSDTINGEAALFDNNGICLLSCTFVNGSIEGETIIFESGIPVFSGSFSRNNKNGYGYEKANGITVYEGYYKDGMRNGIGREYKEDGTEYTDVVYMNGLKLNASLSVDSNNYVMHLYNEKDQLESSGVIDMESGLYCNTVYHYHPDGTISEICTYSKGKLFRILKRFEGPKMMEYDKNGNLIYSGEYASDGDKFYREGTGKEYESDVMVYSGSFRNGVREGSGKEFRSGICVYSGEFRNGKRNGIGQSFGTNGEVEFSGQWIDGKEEMPSYPAYPSLDVPAYPSLDSYAVGSNPPYPQQEETESNPSYHQEESQSIPFYPRATVIRSLLSSQPTEEPQSVSQEPQSISQEPQSASEESQSIPFYPRATVIRSLLSSQPTKESQSVSQEPQSIPFYPRDSVISSVLSNSGSKNTEVTSHSQIEEVAPIPVYPSSVNSGLFSPHANNNNLNVNNQEFASYATDGALQYQSIPITNGYDAPPNMYYPQVPPYTTTPLYPPMAVEPSITPLFPSQNQEYSMMTQNQLPTPAPSNQVYNMLFQETGPNNVSYPNVMPPVDLTSNPIPTVPLGGSDSTVSNQVMHNNDKSNGATSVPQSLSGTNIKGKQKESTVLEEDLKASENTKKIAEQPFSSPKIKSKSRSQSLSGTTPKSQSPSFKSKPSRLRSQSTVQKEKSMNEGELGGAVKEGKEKSRLKLKTKRKTVEDDSSDVGSSDFSDPIPVPKVKSLKSTKSAKGTKPGAKLVSKNNKGKRNLFASENNETGRNIDFSEFRPFPLDTDSHDNKSESTEMKPSVKSKANSKAKVDKEANGSEGSIPMPSSSAKPDLQKKLPPLPPPSSAKPKLSVPILPPPIPAKRKPSEKPIPLPPPVPAKPKLSEKPIPKPPPTPSKPKSEINSSYDDDWNWADSYSDSSYSSYSSLFSSTSGLAYSTTPESKSVVSIVSDTDSTKGLSRSNSLRKSPFPPTERKRFDSTTSVDSNGVPRVLPPKPTRIVPPPLPSPSQPPEKPPKSLSSVFLGSIVSVITVEEMDRAFRFFMDIRTRGNYLISEEIQRFYRQINRARPVVLVLSSNCRLCFVSSNYLIPHRMIDITFATLH